MPTDDATYSPDDTDIDDAVREMFDHLKRRADMAPALGPTAARQLGAHRLRTRTVTTVVAATLLVGGIVAGGWLMGGPTAPVVSVSPKPTPTTTPTVDASPTPEPEFPTGSPVAAPPGCDGDYRVFPAGPHAGEALPAAAMLTAADWGRCWLVSEEVPGYSLYDPAWYGWGQPDPCLDHAAYPADAYRLAGRVRNYHGGIEAGAYESLTRYASGHAHAFLQQVRDRVAACATFPDPYASPGVQHSLIVAESFAGDESLVVWTGPSTTPTEYPASFVAVVRMGDFVIVVNHSFDLGAHLSLAKTMAAKATNRLTAAVGG